MTNLSDPLGRLERFGADVAERAVDSDSLVPHLDPLKDCCARLVVRDVRRTLPPWPLTWFQQVTALLHQHA
jgi:hypothetical protein